MIVSLLIFNSNKEYSFDCTVNCMEQLNCFSMFLNKNEMKRVPTYTTYLRFSMSGASMILW